MSDTYDSAAGQSGYLDDLRIALAQPELSLLEQAWPGGAVPDATRLAAWRLAEALGRCRLLGVDFEAAGAGDLDGTLPVALAVPAAVALARHLTVWTEEARSLGARWEATLEPLEADDLCGDLLQARMDAWAAFVAIDEAYSACLDDGPATDEAAFGLALDEVLSALEAFDEALLREQDLLAAAVDTELLANWRALLAPEHQALPPWWLDGRLEEAGQRAQEMALATQPGAGAWQQVRQQLGRRGHSAGGLPELGEGHLAAGSVPTASLVLVPGEPLCWLSPDGLWRAELIPPERSDTDADQDRQPLNFTRRADDAPAVKLEGEWFSLGEARDTIGSDGKGWVTLAQLRSVPELVLWVGEPPTCWPPEPKP